MTMTTETGAPILTPEEVGDLVLHPIGGVSVAALVSTYRTTSQSGYRLPVVLEDPSAEWVAEGEEIPPSEAELDEVAADWKKLAGLTVVTNELASDSNPDAARVIGEGLVRDLSVKIDQAFFGTRDGNTKRPEGLEDQTVGLVDAGSAWANLDPFNEAIFGAAAHGRNVTSFVTNPGTALTLANLKEATGSNRGLLQPDPTQPGRSLIAGRPLFASPAVTAGTVWAIPQSVAYLVIREDVEVESDGSVYFTSDRMAIRAKMRLDFLFPQPLAIQKITLSA